ncbi:polyprenyl synthetase family protein [Streptomyces sp. NPDC058274]|uniref:polyprenyl synthetase family protein n=1 Tax=Streptomyces sp. NPDC058274 TaxID=3346416 RepID=UPI0036ED9083
MTALVSSLVGPVSPPLVDASGALADSGQPGGGAAALLHRCRTLVAPALTEALGTLHPWVEEMAGYALGRREVGGAPAAHSSGKGVRQALAVLGAEAAGASAATGVPAAVSVELVHTFSLLHDDIMDGDPVRRGRPAVWKAYGTGPAVLAGDALFALAVETLTGGSSAPGAATSDIFGAATPDTRGIATSDTRGPVTSDTRGPVTSDTRGPVTSDTRGIATPDTRGPVTPDTRGPDSPHTPGAVRLLTTALGDLVHGQADDLLFARRPWTGPGAVTVSAYETMAERKTGALLGCALALGAQLAGAPAGTVATLDRIGRHLGVTFQIVDDLLGIWGDPAVTGKPVHSDLRQAKKTLPVLAALDTAEGAGLAELLTSRPALDDAGVRRAATLVEQCGGRSAALREARRHLARAHALLAAAPLDPGATADLRTLLAALTHRTV